MRRWAVQAAAWVCVAAMVIAATGIHALHSTAHRGAGWGFDAPAESSRADGPHGAFSVDDGKTECVICAALGVLNAPDVPLPTVPPAPAPRVSEPALPSSLCVPVVSFLPIGARAPPVAV